MPEAVPAEDACVQPARGPISAPSPDNGAAAPPTPKEKPQVIARAGQPALDFEATAYQEGGFKPVKLSDYKGQWIVLCFYPGDFTFV